MLTMKGENMEELTTAESMVMKTIWDHPHEMALQEIMKLTNETYGKDSKSQTVSTYIAKLVKKGFLRMNQSGRNATYEIIIPELSYQQEQSRKFVKFWNRGSVAQFLTAFYKDHKLTKEEIEELRKSIDELINNLFYMGLFTALTGSIAFAVYAVVAGVLDGLKIPLYIWAVACGVTVLAVSGAVSPVVCHALPQNGGGTVYQGAPV